MKNSPEYWDEKYKKQEEDVELWTWNRTSTWEKVLEVIVDSFEDLHLMTIVDLGCGIGSFCQYLVSELPDDGHTIYGIDTSPWAIQYAKELALENDIGWSNEAYFMVGNAESPPFPTGVDVFTINECLEHLEHPLETLQTLHLLLANHGIVVITTPHDGRIGDSSEHYSTFGHNNLFHLLLKAGFSSVTYYPNVRWFEEDPNLTSILAVARKNE